MTVPHVMANFCMKLNVLLLLLSSGVVATEDPLDEVPSSILESLNKGPSIVLPRLAVVTSEFDSTSQRRMLEDFHNELALARLRAAELNGVRKTPTQVYRVTATVPAFLAEEQRTTTPLPITTILPSTFLPTEHQGSDKNKERWQLLRQQFHRILGHTVAYGFASSERTTTTTHQPRTTTETTVPTTSVARTKSTVVSTERLARLREAFHRLIGHKSELTTTSTTSTTTTTTPTTTTPLTTAILTTTTTQEPTTTTTTTRKPTTTTTTARETETVLTTNEVVALPRLPVLMAQVTRDFQSASAQLSEIVAGVRFEESEALRQAVQAAKDVPGADSWLAPYYQDHPLSRTINKAS